MLPDHCAGVFDVTFKDEKKRKIFLSVTFWKLPRVRPFVILLERAAVHARDKFIEFTCVICLYVNVIYL